MEPQITNKGDPITAANLTAIALAARQKVASPAAPVLGVKVFVIDRAIEGPAVIEDHQYTVTDGSNVWQIDWSQIIVRVQPDLVGPQAVGNPQGFVPAEIVGQGRAVSEVWRAAGILYHLPASNEPGTQVGVVELWGISPHRVC